MENNPFPKMGTVAVILVTEPVLPTAESPESTHSWVETFSDEREITALESAIRAGNPYPLQKVYEYRAKAEKDDEEFGDYVEDLLCQKLLRPEVQSHGVAWLRSKLRIEQFRQQEKDAAEVIAHFALAKVKEDPNLDDFILAGPGVQVRIRIFKVQVAPGNTVIAA